MSATILYAIERDGDVVKHTSFRNAHGGCMAIWRILAEHHLGKTGMEFAMMISTGYKEVFDLAKEGRLAPWEVVTLMTTYDRVVIPIEHVASVASALKKFGEEYGPAQDKRGFVFSVPEQAKALQEIADTAEEKGWRGACWNQMSVSDSLWDGVSVLEKNEDGEEEEEVERERRPYNIDNDSGPHWFWPENKQDEEDASAVAAEA